MHYLDAKIADFIGEPMDNPLNPFAEGIYEAYRDLDRRKPAMFGYVVPEAILDN